MALARPTAANIAELAMEGFEPGVATRAFQYFRPIRKAVGQAAAVAVTGMAGPVAGEIARDGAELVCTGIVVAGAALAAYGFYLVAPAFTPVRPVGEELQFNPTATATPMPYMGTGGGSNALKESLEVLETLRNIIGDYHFGYLMATIVEKQVCHKLGAEKIHVDTVAFVSSYLAILNNKERVLDKLAKHSNDIKHEKVVVPNPVLKYGVKGTLALFKIKQPALRLLTNVASPNRRNNTARSRNRPRSSATRSARRHN